MSLVTRLDFDGSKDRSGTLEGFYHLQLSIDGKADVFLQDKWYSRDFGRSGCEVTH